MGTERSREEARERRVLTCPHCGARDEYGKQYGPAVDCMACERKFARTQGSTQPSPRECFAIADASDGIERALWTIAGQLGVLTALEETAINDRRKEAQAVVLQGLPS